MEIRPVTIYEAVQYEDLISPAPITFLITKRQKETLRLICEGLSSKQIASNLGITEQTVKNHISSMLIATKSKNRIDLALRCIKGKIKLFET